MSHEKRFTRGERALIGLGILVPTLALAWVGMDRKLNTVPEFVPPPQSVPAPNAMETLRDAYSQRVNIWAKPKMRHEDMLKAPLAERQKQLAANQKAIAHIRTALEQNYASPIDWQNPAAQTFPHYAEQRELARLLAFASRTHADLGNRQEALRCGLDAVELGILISGDGPLIGLLVGIACESIGRKAVWEQLDSLSPEEARAALTRLEGLEKRRSSDRKFLAIERAYAQKMISDLASRRVKPADFITSLGVDGSNKGESGRLMLALAVTDKGAAWEASGRYYEALDDYWGRPYTRGQMPQPPTDAINQFLAPVFEQSYFTTTRNLTDSSLLRGALQLRIQGSPAEFEAPADPFNQNQPLRYEKTAIGYRLWSVGPDGIDNGGKPVTIKNKDSRGYDSTSDGDVVARINTF